MRDHPMYPPRGDPSNASISETLFGDLMGMVFAVLLVWGGLLAIPWTVGPTSPYDSLFLRDSATLLSSQVPLTGPEATPSFPPPVTVGFFTEDLDYDYVSEDPVGHTNLRMHL
jgi:hypothetical protein